ncbi:MAG: amino acid permease, partial [Mycoplasmataceae bacterium]|nr:amino acid permease [Mycoplasmataceae bacterium]
YLTALIIVTGGTIGSGIFLKNQSILANSHSDLVYAILSWIVSIFGVMAIGFSLVELSSSSKNDQGILTWLKNFSHTKIHKFSSSYMLLIYYPLTIVCMPIYVVNSMDDVSIGISGNPLFTNQWLPSLLALGIVTWLLFFSWFSLKLSEGIQWGFTIIKFIPIIILPIFAYIAASNGGEVTKPPAVPDGLNGIHPALGVIASIPAILFAFDGFFTITTLRSNLKNKNHMSWIMLVGLTIISSVYLYLSISFSLAPNNGSSSGIEGMPSWLKILLNSMIVSAVLGIANAYCMSTNRVYEIATEQKNFYLLSFMYKKLPKISRKTCSFLFIWLTTIAIYAVLTPISILIWKPGSDDYLHIYAAADFLTNYTSLFAFVFIGISIIGAILNRRTGKVAVEKSKLFLPFAIISIIFLSVGTIYFFLQPVIDIFLIKDQESIISNITLLVILFLTLLISWLHSMVETHLTNKFKDDYLPDGYITIEQSENEGEEIIKKTLNLSNSNHPLG